MASAKKTQQKRVRRTREESRQLILEAAIRVFSEHGPDAVGLKEVAAEGGVSHALVVHYFGSYEGLVDATVASAMSRVRQRMIEGIRSLPKPSAEALVQLYLDAALEPWYGRLASWALMRNHQAVDEMAARMVPDMQTIVDITRRLLAGRTGQPASREQAETLIVAVWSMVIGYVVGRDFIWRALDRAPGPERDQALRDAIATAARLLFGEVDALGEGEGEDAKTPRPTGR